MPTVIDLSYPRKKLINQLEYILFEVKMRDIKIEQSTAVLLLLGVTALGTQQVNAQDITLTKKVTSLLKNIIGPTNEFRDPVLLCLGEVWKVRNYICNVTNFLWMSRQNEELEN